MYTLEDKDEILLGRSVAVVGYGNQGRPQALNLRDSGMRPVIALRAGSRSRPAAEADGFDVMTPEEALRACDVFVILIPDEEHPAFFSEYVYSSLKKGQTFIFAHGFSMVFGGLSLKEYPVNIGLLSPKGPGTALRQRFLSGEGLPGVMAAEQDVTGDLKRILISYAYFTGMLARGVHETTFREETVCDLFGEQAALCGGTIELMKKTYGTLASAGYSPEMAYFETIFEMKAIIDMIYDKGIEYMREKISDTAEFGAYEAAERLFDGEFDKRMERMLKDIENGGFAERWIADHKDGRRLLKKKRDDEKKSDVIMTERAMRKKGLI